MQPLSKRLKDIIKSTVEKVLDDTLKDEIGKTVAERVKRRTRLGKGVDKDGAKAEKLEKLSDRYIEKRSKNKSKLSKETRPKKSNLTFSGDMLDNIDYKVEGDTIIIFIEGKHNNDKAQWVTDGGRAFMNLSSPEQNEVIRIIRQRIKNVTR